MRSVQLPLNTKPYYNTDSVATSTAPDDMVDCYMEQVPGFGYVTRRRPGLKTFGDTATGVLGDGLFYWDALECVVAVSGGKAFKVESDGTCTEMTGTFPGASGTTCIFADGQAIDGTPWLYMAAGGLVYTNDAVTMTAPTDINTPLSTHVGWINGRFIGNTPDSNQWLFTDTNTGTGNMENDYWSSTDNPLTCEAKADDLKALFSVYQDIYAWGSQGLEIWQDDGATPFVPIQGAFNNSGLEAIYGYTVADNTVFALCVYDGKRVIIRMVGRQPQVISEPIARILADMSDVADATATVISTGGMAIVLFSFPTAGQSWAYDYKSDIWYKWGYWNTGTATHGRFLGQHACFAKAWNKHLIQSRLDGQIYEIDRDTYQDDSTIMVSYRKTGWIDHNTWSRKKCHRLIVKAKVFSTSETETTLSVRWSDDGNPVYENWISVSLNLNPSNQGTFTIPITRCGMYRSRKYEFRLTSNQEMAIVGAAEEIEVMDN
jgi:hypothetical protein